MFRLLQYYGKYQNARGTFGSMPSWARLILLIVAIPGIIGILLAILVFCVSIAALLLLTTPVFRLMQWMGVAGQTVSPSNMRATEFIDPAEPTIGPPANEPPTMTVEPFIPDRPRRQVDVRIIE
jgi:hypothetical protein